MRLEEALLLRDSFVGEAGGVHVVPLELHFLVPHAVQKLRGDVLQRQVQVGVDAQIGPGVVILRVYHALTPLPRPW